MAGAGITGTADVSRVEAPVTVKAYLICAFAAFGGIFFGYDTGWMSGVLGMPYFISMYTGHPYNHETGEPTTVDKATFALSSSRKSLMTSILSCGTFFGALIAGDLADFIGRRPTIIAGCGVFCVGCIMQIASTNQEALFVLGRLIAGLGVGFISAIIILYMSEIAPKKVRGALVSGYQFCITIGILLANCVVYATQGRDDSGSYRIPIGVQFLWAIILATGLFILPESPRYHVKKGNVEMAARCLSRIRGQPEDSDYIKDELAEIVANNEYETKVIPQTNYIGSWLACFKGSLFQAKSNLRRTLLGAGMQMCQQLTGINFIFYFGTVFFKNSGISNPFLITIATNIINVFMTLPGMWGVERFGRRRLLLVGAVGMCVCEYLVAIVGVTISTSNTAGQKVLIAFVCIYIAFFASTWGPIAWVITGEIFPLNIRAKAMSLSVASNWLWNFGIGYATPYLVNKEPGSAGLEVKVFFIWGSTCAGCFLFTYFCVPETKGLSLEQIDLLYQNTTPMKSVAFRRQLEQDGVELSVGHAGGHAKHDAASETEKV